MRLAVAVSALPVHLLPPSPAFPHPFLTLAVSDLSATMTIKGWASGAGGACCFPACVPTAPQRARWPGATNKLCIQTVDATNGAVQWTNSRAEQLKRC